MLSKYGYKDVLHTNREKRRKSLKRALKAYGGPTLIRRLNAVSVLNRNRNPRLSKTFRNDMHWVQKQYRKSKSR